MPQGFPSAPKSLYFFRDSTLGSGKAQGPRRPGARQIQFTNPAPRAAAVAMETAGTNNSVPRGVSRALGGNGSGRSSGSDARRRRGHRGASGAPAPPGAPPLPHGSRASVGTPRGPARALLRAPPAVLRLCPREGGRGAQTMGRGGESWTPQLSVP